jgi:hypothetical protein
MEPPSVTRVAKWTNTSVDGEQHGFAECFRHPLYLLGSDPRFIQRADTLFVRGVRVDYLERLTLAPGPRK